MIKQIEYLKKSLVEKDSWMAITAAKGDMASKEAVDMLDQEGMDFASPAEGDVIMKESEGMDVDS